VDPVVDERRDCGPELFGVLNPGRVAGGAETGGLEKQPGGVWGVKVCELANLLWCQAVHRMCRPCAAMGHDSAATVQLIQTRIIHSVARPCARCCCRVVLSLHGAVATT